MDDAVCTEAFSPNRPRLVGHGCAAPAIPAARQPKSRQQGALQYAFGCFSTIRKPATHEQAEWDQKMALECVAALSVLARGSMMGPSTTHSDSQVLRL
jgi:hypothetical protein